MARLAVAAVVAAAAVVGAACDREDGADRGLVDAPADDRWGQPAVELFEAMEDALEADDTYALAHLTPASLDLTAWGGPVAASAEEASEALRDVWFVSDPRRDSAVTDLLAIHLDADGAVVRWHADDGERAETWMQRYDVGDDGRMSSGVYAVRGWASDDSVDELHRLIDRYLRFWASDGTVSADDVYADGAVVRDGTTGREWSGDAAIAGSRATAPPVQLAPAPAVFLLPAADRLDAIVSVETGGECPMLEARQWQVVDGRISSELRSAEVLSARRCVPEPVGGWWTTYQVPLVPERAVAQDVEIDGEQLELVNAEAAHRSYVQFLFGRFADAGLERPAIAAIRFPPSSACTSRGGLTTEHDPVYDGAVSVTLCFRDRDLYRRDGDDAPRAGGTVDWSAIATTYGLHELGHVWMLQHLPASTQVAFLDRIDLANWDDPDDEWPDRGVEHAASTIAWGVAGDALARYLVVPAPPCEELAARYRLLTGREPATTCAGDDEEAVAGEG